MYSLFIVYQNIFIDGQNAFPNYLLMFNMIIHVLLNIPNMFCFFSQLSSISYFILTVFNSYVFGDLQFLKPLQRNILLLETVKNIELQLTLICFGFQVVEQGMFVKHCKVEVYLTELKLCENGNMNNVVTRRFSKADTIGNTRSCFFVEPLLSEIQLLFYYILLG